MSRIDTGDAAAELTLSTHSGQQITLADYRGKKAVVLFFYPKDGTGAGKAATRRQQGSALRHSLTPVCGCSQTGIQVSAGRIWTPPCVWRC